MPPPQGFVLTVPWVCSVLLLGSPQLTCFHLFCLHVAFLESPSPTIVLKIATLPFPQLSLFLFPASNMLCNLLTYFFMSPLLRF